MATSKSKEPIKLRKRKTSTGLVSLYLDIYINGRRSYEYLKLYLVPEKSREDKRKNAETMKLAEAIKSQRVVDFQNGRFGFAGQNKGNVLFFEYYEKLRQKRLKSGEKSSNWFVWGSCLKHLQKYEPNHNITFNEITTEWIKGFRDYLLNEVEIWVVDNNKHAPKTDKRLHHNTCQAYLNKLKTCLNQACDDNIIERNPMKGVEGLKREEGTRMYLTLEELKRLAATPCEYDSIKRAFLFSCLTGLRRSDVVKMTWSEVHNQSGLVRIIFRQKKTDGQEYLDITPQAAELMGERKQSEECVFDYIYTSNKTNNIIQQWVFRAGINKKITFHCARHTFAVMMLDLGTDIYTVSKLLGHSDISTTQIYAKILDKNKQAAVLKIPSILQ